LAAPSLLMADALQDRPDMIAVADRILARRSTTQPAPEPKTVPCARWSKAWQWPSGDRISPSV
jgi:hypothetical protein